MDGTRSKICFLSGNALKIIAAISMFIDHLGVIFFPDVEILRIIGRIAFPIFAFMIAEGCRYTKNKLRYFLTVFCMGVVYVVAFYVYIKVVYMSIFITFSLSIIMIYALQSFKDTCFDKKSKLPRKILLGGMLAVSVIGSYVLNRIFRIDYGFVGAITPVLASLPHKSKDASVKFFEAVDRIEFSICGLAVGLLGLYAVYGGVRLYALLAIPLLLLYSGQRGRRKMKYFFYVFYPTHLLFLEGAYMLWQMIK